MKLKGILFLLSGLLLGVLLGALVLLGGSNRADAAERRLPPTVGSPVGDFKLTRLDGQAVQLSDLRGQPVVINFWATWCAPCKEEMPLLQRYADQHADRLILLGVDYMEDAEVVRRFMTDNDLNFPILLDQDGAAADLYFVRNFPTTFFIDADGVLRAQHLGLLREEQLVSYLETIGLPQ